MNRLPIILSLLLAAAAALVAPASARAQQTLAAEAVPGRLAAADSARLLRAARSEQSRFEVVRRSNLPWTMREGGGPCDERIGRFCLTHGSRGREWEPPEDPEPVVGARDRLLLNLGLAAAYVPGDGWVTGQRVRYHLEAGEPEEAIVVARQCRAVGWWCAALAGFAYHHTGDPAAADAAFSDALRLMPADERQRWLDLGMVLEDQTLRVYRRLDEREREAFAERYWRLASPFYMRSGNDLRSEHLARHVWDQLQDRSRSTENISWGWDLRQIVLRYGWPIGWERVRNRPGSLDVASLVSHYPSSNRNFLPPPEIFRGEDGIAGGEWDVEATRPRTGYSLHLTSGRAKWFERLDHQVAVFRRGDSALVVATYELPADSLAPDAEIVAALALFPADAEAPRVTPFPGGGLRGTLVASAPPHPVVASVEVLAEAEQRAARARFGLPLRPTEPGALAVSDLLLLREPEPLPDSLAPAVENARASVRVRPGERVGVYWELYGLSADRPEPLSMSLRLLEERGGWLRRLGRRVGLLSDDVPVRLRWQEQAEPDPIVGRSVSIEIPPLSPGTYTLELVVARAGREELTSRRVLEVEG
jgi:hypothetical protein